MADFFYTNGFVILKNALAPEMISQLKNDLNTVETHYKNRQNIREKKRLIRVLVIRFINVF